MLGTQKILYIITKSAWFGAQRYVHDLATGFKDDYKVVVALGGSGELSTRLGRAGIRTVSVRAFQRDVSFRKEVMAFYELVRIIRREHPDIVHVNSSKAGGLGALAARLCGVGMIVFTVHGWPFREKRSRMGRLLIFFFSWLTAVCAHTVILVAEADMKATRRMPFVRKKCVVIHNGRAPVSFVHRTTARKNLKEMVSALRKSTARGVLVGAVGELTRNKAFDVLIWAMRAVVDAYPTTQCVVVGEGEEHNNLERLIGHLGLTQHVFLVGYRSAAEVMSAFDIFVLPSHKEGLPYTVLEAGQAGLPVVASRVGGIPEIITDGQSGALVRPGDADDVVRALMVLLAHPDKRRVFGDVLEKVVTERFSLAHMLHETKRLYQRRL